MTDTQRKLVEEELHHKLSYIITDNVDRNDVVDTILDEVISDIDSCAEWDDYEDDEINTDDVNIALARVLISCVNIAFAHYD